MGDTKGVGEAPALGVSINAQFAAGRQIVFQSYVPQEAPVEEINALLDKLNNAIDRQESWYQIEQLEKEVERDEQILYSINHNMQEVEANMRARYEAGGKRAPFKMSEKEVVQKKQAEDNVTRQTKILEGSKRRLEEARAKAGKRNVASSPADR